MQAPPWACWNRLWKSTSPPPLRPLHRLPHRPWHPQSARLQPSTLRLWTSLQRPPPRPMALPTPHPSLPTCQPHRTAPRCLYPQLHTRELRPAPVLHHHMVVACSPAAAGFDAQRSHRETMRRARSSTRRPQCLQQHPQCLQWRPWSRSPLLPWKTWQTSSPVLLPQHLPWRRMLLPPFARSCRVPSPSRRSLLQGKSRSRCAGMRVARGSLVVLHGARSRQVKALAAAEAARQREAEREAQRARQREELERQRKERHKVRLVVYLVTQCALVCPDDVLLWCDMLCVLQAKQAEEERRQAEERLRREQARKQRDEEPARCVPRCVPWVCASTLHLCAQR